MRLRSGGTALDFVRVLGLGNGLVDNFLRFLSGKEMKDIKDAGLQTHDLQINGLVQCPLHMLQIKNFADMVWCKHEYAAGGDGIQVDLRNVVFPLSSIAGQATSIARALFGEGQ